MKSRLIAPVALSVLLILPANSRAEEKDPCLTHTEGQRLADSLYNIDLMVKLLGHLKGCEDSKLKGLVEVNLQWAAAAAREAVDRGAVLASPYIAVNFIRPVRKAMHYASQHQLKKVPGQEARPDTGQDLRVVEAWLQKNE